jgi:drug/metabolite transporter (DMT)-like permease
MKTHHTFAYIAMLLAAVGWGTSYTIVRIGLAYLDPPLPPLGYLALRFSFALLLLTPILGFEKMRKNIINLSKRKDIAFLGLINGVAFTLQFIGQVGTPAAIATLMINTYLISTPIFSSYILKEHISSKMMISVLLGLIGVIMIVFGGFKIPDEEINFFLVSTSIVLLSGLSWGAYGVVSSIINNRIREKNLQTNEYVENNPLTVFYASNIYSVGLILILTTFFFQWPSLKILSTEAWFAIIYLALFCTLMPFTFYIYASKVIKPTELNVITLLNVIIGIVLANIILSEELSHLGILGSFLIIFSIYLASTDKSRDLSNSE